MRIFLLPNLEINQIKRIHKFNKLKPYYLNINYEHKPNKYSLPGQQTDLG